jgi:hypothetical protein
VATECTSSVDSEMCASSGYRMFFMYTSLPRPLTHSAMHAPPSGVRDLLLRHYDIPLSTGQCAPAVISSVKTGGAVTDIEGRRVPGNRKENASDVHMFVCQSSSLHDTDWNRLVTGPRSCGGVGLTIILTITPSEGDHCPRRVEVETSEPGPASIRRAYLRGSSTTIDHSRGF